MDRKILLKKLEEIETLLIELKNEIKDKALSQTDKNTRKETCNFCRFAISRGLPDGVICHEPHHIEAGIREQHQYYGHKCQYFDDDGKTDIYDLLK